MCIVVKEKPGQKVSVCPVATVGLCLCLPPVGGNSRFVAVISTDFFGVNSHCESIIDKSVRDAKTELVQDPAIVSR